MFVFPHRQASIRCGRRAADAWRPRRRGPAVCLDRPVECHRRARHVSTPGVERKKNEEKERKREREEEEEEGQEQEQEEQEEEEVEKSRKTKSMNGN